MRTGHSLCHRRNTLHEVSGRQPRFARRTAPPCELNFRPNRFISLIGAGKEQTAWITSFSRRPAFPFFLFSTRSNDFVLLPPTTPPTLISASRHSLPSAACCIHIHLQSLHPPRPQSPHCQTNIPSSQLRGKQVLHPPPSHNARHRCPISARRFHIPRSTSHSLPPRTFWSRLHTR